ncbi:MAG: 3-oxoacyl-ACP reductase FabG [Deltaproteobacteria bacterium]|nr:MAG: 3-oxoacyl-ACP reductase FabG [Deltaproteobacteria bacterium]
MAAAHRALVTGASRGIGRAVARQLARQGVSLVVNYRQDDDAAEEVAAFVRAQGVECELLRCDVADIDETTSRIKAFIKQRGPIDIVVNNAGIKRDMLFAAMKADTWRRIIEVTLHGFFAVTRPCIRGMLGQGWGRIVNISSAAALAPSPGQVNYSAAKAGLVGATRSLSAELCSRGITVNCVAPGFIDTDMLQDVKVPLEQLLQVVPMGRLGRPEEVAQLVTFLVSEEAGYISGQVIGVNGGMF